MSNIVIGGITYNGVNTIKVKDTNDNDVSFNENPFLVDVSQPPLEKYLGKLCKDTTTGQEYMVARGNSETFVKKTNFPVSACYQDAMFVNGKFFIVCYVSTTFYVYSSTDGNTWNLAFSDTWVVSGNLRIRYGNGIYIVYCTSSNWVKYSTDLTTWNTYTYSNNSTLKFLSCAFGNGRFVFHTTYTSAGTTYYAYEYTTDFTSFNRANYTTSNPYATISFANGYFHKIFGSSQTFFEKSLDGITWSSEFNYISGLQANTDGGLLYFENGNYYYMKRGDTGIYVRSESASSWTSLYTGSSYPVYSFLYVNNTFYIGCTGGKVAKSTTGSSWTNISFTSENFTVARLISDGSKIIGTYGNGASNLNTYYVSSDSSDNLYYRPIYY